MEKLCSRCQYIKEDSAFYFDKRLKSGLSSWCKKCCSKYASAMNKKHKTRYAERMKNSQHEYHTNNLERVMCASAKKRAKNKGIEFNLKPEDIIIPEYCPILGMRLVIHEDKAHDNSPSLDRIDPSIGYIPGNICVISNKANRLKNNATIEQIEAILRYMKERICPR